MVMPPEADLHEMLSGVWDEMDLDLFVKRHISHLDLMFEEGTPLTILRSRRQKTS